AGYDLGDPAGATKALDELFATLGDPGGLFPPHNSPRPAAARRRRPRPPRTSPPRRPARPGRDRPCPIGTGPIGDQGFAAVLAHPGLATLPVITETTGDPDQMAADLARLQRLRPAPRG